MKSNFLVSILNLLNNKKFADAENLINESKDISDEGELLIANLMLYLSSNEIEKAVDFIDKNIEEIKNKNDERKRLSAEVFRRSARIKDALQLSKEAYENNNNNVDFQYTYAECLMANGEYNKAIPIIEKVLEKLDSSVALCTLALCYRKVDNNYKAEKLYLKAADKTPDYIDAWIGYISTLYATGKYSIGLSAIEDLEKKKLFNSNLLILKAAIQERLGRFEESASIYKRIVTEVKTVSTFMNAGWAEYSAGHDDKALAYFRQASEKYHPPNFRDFNAIRKGKVPITIEKFKAKHDLQQMKWLYERGLLASDFIELMEGYSSIIESVGDNQAITISPNTKMHETALKWHQDIAYIYLPKKLSHVLNPKLDKQNIELNYLKRKPSIIVVDNFLTDDALTELRNFCLATTGFRRAYANGYHGIFLESGFANQIILQLAREFCSAFPRIVNGSRLTQSWAFKYDSNMKGINIHADFAKINANFWITPDEFNLKPEKGGMIIYDVPSPREWSFEDYNSSGDKIRKYLKENNAKAWRVPYKQNRCVFFDSTLFHETDEVHFVEGYESRRVNVTLLFGRGLRDDVI
jgi:tetratricopeptide (TPR) repeat protein